MTCIPLRVGPPVGRDDHLPTNGRTNVAIAPRPVYTSRSDHPTCSGPVRQDMPLKSGAEDGALRGEEIADSGFGEVEHLVELGAGVGVFFRGGLGFY
jgi:hypothetical protein